MKLEKTEPTKKIKWYWWVIIAIALIGFGRATVGSKVVTKEVPTTVVKACDYADWKALKSKDDEFINMASKGFFVVSEAMYAVTNLDTDTMARKVTELENITSQVQKLTPEREELLKKVGY